MKKLIFGLGLIILFAACVPRVEVTRLTPTIYPPTDHVDILQTKPTDRKYFAIAGVGIELGKVKEAYQAIQMLVKTAQELGADALLLLGVKEIGQTVTLINYGSWQAGRAYPDSYLMGAAIKYAPEPFVVRYTSLTFPPTSSVEVLAARPASREYIELAEISLSLRIGFTPENVLFILYEEARKLGADALIILSEKEKLDVNIGIMMGVAIKYKQPEPLH